MSDSPKIWTFDDDAFHEGETPGMKRRIFNGDGMSMCFGDLTHPSGSRRMQGPFVRPGGTFGRMTAGYAIAHLRTPQINEDVLDYLERIQGTLDPHGGRFIVHGATVEEREGEWPGTIVVIQFPDVDSTRAWYESEAYQAILPKRTDHIEGEAIIVEGVVEGYEAANTAALLRAAAAAQT